MSPRRCVTRKRLQTGATPADTMEVTWDACTVAAIGIPYDRAQWREVRTLSGGEQKRLALEALLRGPDEVLLLDEPDNYLDVPGKQWLEQQLANTQKTVLLISHDRELLARSARPDRHCRRRVVMGAWRGIPDYHQARRERHERLDELRRRWDEKHEQLKELVRTLRIRLSTTTACRAEYQAAKTRLAKFEEAGPPEECPREQNVRMRLKGGRTGVRAITCHRLELTGLMQPFDLEVFYGERVAVLGSNGSGKSHFLRLLAAGDVERAPLPTAEPGSWAHESSQATSRRLTIIRSSLARRWSNCCGPSIRCSGRGHGGASSLRVEPARRPTLRHVSGATGTLSDPLAGTERGDAAPAG